MKGVQILSAVFSENFDIRQVAGPSTRIDLTGIYFSQLPPEPFPFVLTPHLVILIACGAHDRTTGALEVVFEREGEQLARNVQPLEVEQNKFAYRLVRPELEVQGPSTLEAHCRIDLGPVTVVPLTILDPA